jgi:HK97 family phage portal protein
MGWIDKIASAFRPRGSENVTIDNALTMDEYARRLTGGAEANSGVYVSPETALRYSTVLACVRVLSESVASLPCILYRRRADGGKDRATEHPLYTVLHDRANSWNTAFEYFEGSAVNAVTRGNAYSLVERNRKGQTINLIPLHPDPVQITQGPDWAPRYEVTLPDNRRRKLLPGEMHHVRGPLPQGYVGRSMIGLAREAIGLGLAAESFGSHMYRNGARPTGVLETDKRALSPEAVENLRAQFAERYSGLDNAGKPLILEEGMKWAALSMTAADAEFILSRKFQRSEIAAIFRVPPHMIGDLERATFSNIEHQSLEFVMHTLRPWLKRWEQAISRDLLAPSERGEYFAEFLVDDLLRGDFKTRMDGYAILVQNKILNANEVRAKENMNPRPGGEVYENPSIQVDKPGTQPPKKAA